MSKKEELKQLVVDMLNDSHSTMVKRIDTVLTSGCIDVDGWDSSMVLPKCITTALLQRESVQYMGKGTCYERQVKKEVKNIMYFI